MTTTTQPAATNIRDEIMAVTDGLEEAGAVVWWELDGSVSSTDLGNAWTNAGFDPDILPDAVTPRAALKRAMRSLAEKRKLVRPLSGEEGYSLVDETADGENLAYNQSVTAIVTDDGTLKITPSGTTLHIDIVMSYTEQLRSFDATDISSMLVQFTRTLEAVALRSRGGFYFLPPAALKQFRAAAEVIRRVSKHVFFEIPAMQTKSLVAAVLASVEREAVAEMEAFEKALSDESGSRALKTKMRECQAVASKVSHYENLLGTSLVALQSKLSGLQARLSEAVLLAEVQTSAAA